MGAVIEGHHIHICVRALTRLYAVFIHSTFRRRQRLFFVALGFYPDKDTDGNVIVLIQVLVVF